MGQILRIFRKDVRHFWIEICASLLAVSAYVWRVLHEWGHPQSVMGLPNFLRGLLMALGPISWCLLVVRAVQDESLVDDRQFWVTRPYEWEKLLAAKALFVVLFVNMPLFTANVIFLASSGFSPTRYLVGLLWIQLLIVIVLVLPVASVSVVTSTIVQVLLWMLGIGTYVAGVASLSSLIPDSHIPTSTDNSDFLSMGIFAVVCLGMVLWQYTQRRAWIPRAVIVGAAVVIAAGALVPTTATQIARAYPPLAVGEQPPFHLTPIPPKPSPEDQDEAQASEKKVALSVPIRASGVAGDSLVVIAGTRVAIRTRNGGQWTSKWVNDGWEIWPGEQTVSVPLEIDRSFFEQSRFVPTNLRITFAFTEDHEMNTRQIITQAGEFPVDGVGICWVSSPLVDYRERNVVGCRWPLKASPTLARYETSMSTCPRVPHKTEGPPTTRYASYLNETSGPADLAMIPIQTSTFYFTQPDDRDDTTVFPGVCPGTPITLSTPTVARIASTEVEIDGADLRDYLPQPVRVSSQ